MSEKIRNGREFGQYSLIGDHADDQGFFEKDAQGKAVDLAWSHACVIAQELTNPNHPVYGPEWMIKRYGETNFWFGYIVAEAKKTNPRLSEALSRSVPRNVTEPVGVYEQESVPQNHISEMSPMSRIYGYALPRILIEAFGKTDQRNAKRTQAVLHDLDSFIEMSQSPDEFLLLLSNSAILFFSESDSKKQYHEVVAFAKELLSHILPAGVFEEEHCVNDYSNILVMMERYSQTLWRTYNAMNHDEKRKLGIAEYTRINEYRLSKMLS